MLDDLMPRPYVVYPKRKSSESGKNSINDSAVSFKQRKKSPKATTSGLFEGNYRKSSAK
jgi:hypothetical protein